MMTTITVLCADPAHDDQSVTVERFARVRAPAPYVYDSGWYVADPERVAAAMGVTPAGELFVGAEWPRYQLRCLCGRTVPVVGSKMHPILDALAEHGVSSISLQGLAARLSP